MKLSLHPTALYRIPKFSSQASLADCWAELKADIALSSTAFYKTIQHIKEDQLDELPPAIRNTIWKYFNRACFRSTPYATFANIGLCALRNWPEDSTLLLQPEVLVHAFTDWTHKADITISQEQIVNDDLLLFSNSSYYLIGEAIRYISHLEGSFQLSEIDQDDLVLEILRQCKHPISYSMLNQCMEAQGFELVSVLNLITELIDLQLLLCSRHANIIGEDYFKRLEIPLEQFPGQYLLCERKLQTGQLDAQLFKDLPGAIDLLHQLIPQNDPEPLKQFISRFTRKFEGQQVPIMQALDPEQGVGYGDFEAATGVDELIGKFAGRKNNQNAEAKYKFQQLLFCQILEGSLAATQVIQLEQLAAFAAEEKKGNAEDKFVPLPNSVSALLTLADEYVCIDSIGGTTANTLLGRFTLAGEHFHRHCQTIAGLEQEANPEVLFFDVAYMAEGKVDNVNRRKAIYPLQLSILNYDTSENPLTLDDILVYLQGGQLMLRSKKLDKRLVPRFSTAYNYSRSDLSLFRFLCDLQNQGIQSDLNLSLRSLLPNAPFYPRIQYKNIIVAPATWRIRDTELSKMLNDVVALETLLQQKGVSQLFRAGSGDQTLRYDQLNREDLENFLMMLRKQKTVYIEEAFAEQNSLVIDSSGQPYHCQLLMSISHQEAIYRDFPMLDSTLQIPGVQKNIAPGKDWLYFEIYCNQQRNVSLLLGPIADLLHTYKSYLKKWFFINYNENGDHLRLRLQLKDPSHSYPITAALNELLNEDIQNGVISDLQLKTYKRETHRYGWATMADIESHFCVDSEYALAVLQTDCSDMDKYQLCVGLMQAIQNSEALTEKEFNYVVDKISNSFNKEHQLLPADFKELNNMYRTYKTKQALVVDTALQLRIADLLESFIYCLGLFPGLEKRSILMDLFHMHVNRLFSANQRTHEMVIYYLLVKENQRLKAQKTKVQEAVGMQDHSPLI